MRAEEYLRIATGDIAEPARACDAYRELKAHLEEGTAEVMAQGVDPHTAALVAMARMGAPKQLALSLAAAHHRHIPWRHYLAVVPLACLTACVGIMGDSWWRPGRWFVPILLLCLAPNGTTLQKWLRLLQIDLRAKWHWLHAQPIRAALIAGASAGVVAGVTWSTLPLWHVSGLGMILLLPLVAALGVLWLLRRLATAPIMLTACFGALAFPAGSLPGVFAWNVVPIAWLFFLVAFGMLAVTVGGFAHILQRKGWLSRT